jgi:hypothetical protein
MLGDELDIFKHLFAKNENRSGPVVPIPPPKSPLDGRDKPPPPKPKEKREFQDTFFVCSDCIPNFTCVEPMVEVHRTPPEDYLGEKIRQAIYIVLECIQTNSTLVLDGHGSSIFSKTSKGYLFFDLRKILKNQTVRLPFFDIDELAGAFLKSYTTRNDKTESQPIVSLATQPREQPPESGSAQADVSVQAIKQLYWTEFNTSEFVIAICVLWEENRIRFVAPTGIMPGDPNYTIELLSNNKGENST